MRYLGVVLCLFNSALCFATGSGGFGNDGTDTRGLAQGSAFVARADSPATNWYNPAGLTKLEGRQIGGSLLYEHTDFNLDSDLGPNVDCKKGDFFIPALYFTDNLGNGWAYGVGINSAYGLGTDWNNPITDYVATKTELQILDLNPNLAYALNDQISIAFGLDIGNMKGDMEKKINQTFLNSFLYYAMTGNQALILSPDARFKLKADDYALSWNVGVLGKINEALQVGLTFRNKIKYDMEGDVKLDGLTGPAAAVFGGSSYQTPASMELNTPSTFDLGIAWKITDKTTAEFDVEYALWSTCEQMELKYGRETNPVRLAVLNNGNPIPRDWKDTWNYGLGVEHRLDDLITLSCGTRYRPAVVPERTMDPCLPSVDMYELGAGVSFDLKGSSIDVALDYIWGDRDITNSIGNDSGTSINGNYGVKVSLLSVGYRRKI